MSAQWLLIAEFARRCRLPVSTLRYYDSVGLLRPAAIDDRTGYRRYTAEQLPDALIIAGLRSIGTSPDTIARILRGGPARDAALATERTRLSDEITERRRALARLDQLLHPSRPGVLEGPGQVELRSCDVPALPFLSDVAGLAATLRRRLAVLRSRLRQQPLVAIRWGALLPLDLDDPVTGHVFAQIHEDHQVDPTQGLEVVPLPRGNGMRVTYHGPDDTLASAYSPLLAAIAEAGAHSAGPVIEYYRTTRHSTATEVIVPFTGGPPARPPTEKATRTTQAPFSRAARPNAPLPDVR